MVQIPLNLQEDEISAKGNPKVVIHFSLVFLTVHTNTQNRTEAFDNANLL